MKHWPSDGMFGIKKVGPGFLNYPQHWPASVDQPALMSFTKAGAAAVIPMGHRALLYITGPDFKDAQILSDSFYKFVAEIEFVGTLEDGRKALQNMGLTPGEPLPGADAKFSLFRPIRYLYRVDFKKAKTRQQVCAAANVTWTPLPQPNGHEYISQNEFQNLRKAITGGDDTPASAN